MNAPDHRAPELDVALQAAQRILPPTLIGVGEVKSRSRVHNHSVGLATSADNCATPTVRQMGDDAHDSNSSSAATNGSATAGSATAGSATAGSATAGSATAGSAAAIRAEPVTDQSADLVARVQQGDRQAFATLFQRHRSDVARLIQRMIGRSPSQIEDLVQDVFLQVHRSIGDFRGQSRFSTWLYRITVNVVLMNRRARKSRPQYADEDQAPAAPDPALLPDEQAARNQRVRAFYGLLEHLSDKKRQVFVLHELEGVSPQDISDIVGAPVLTVRTRLFYARKELASLLLADPTLAPLAKGFERKRQGEEQSMSTTGVAAPAQLNKPAGAP